MHAATLQALVEERNPLYYPPASEVSRGRYRHLFSGHGAFADGGPKHPHVGSSNSGGDDYSASTYATSSPPFSSTPMGASPLMSGSLYERRGDAQPPAGGSAGYSPPSQDGYRQHYSPSFSGPDPYGARSGGGRGFAAGGAWMMDPYGYPMPSPPSDMGMYPRAPAPGMMPPHHRGSGGGGGPMPQRQGHGLGAPTAHGGSGPRILSRFKTKLCSYYMDSKGMFCPHGATCQFAHGVAELRVPGPPGSPSLPAPPDVIASVNKALEAHMESNAGAPKRENVGGGFMPPMVSTPLSTSAPLWAPASDAPMWRSTTSYVPTSAALVPSSEGLNSVETLKGVLSLIESSDVDAARRA